MDLEWLTVTAALAVPACSSIAEPDRDAGAPIQTDRLSYSITESDQAGLYSSPEIRLTLTNLSGGAAFLTQGTRELEVFLEGLENGEWVPKYSKTYADGEAVHCAWDPARARHSPPPSLASCPARVRALRSSI